MKTLLRMGKEKSKARWSSPFSGGTDVLANMVNAHAANN